MKKEFLKNWRGEASSFGGEQNKWRPAQGSSLSDEDKASLNTGGIVLKPKGKSMTKIFVKDEDNEMWSVIVRNIHVPAIKEDLKGIGYLLPAA